MGKSQRVLVAEDEATVALGLTALLEEMGHQVVGHAPDGEAAIRMAHELKPDLMIMDIKMSPMDGLSAAREILNEHPAPIVFITGYANRDWMDQAAELGAFAYLTKPVRPPDLAAAIELAVARFAELQALRGKGQRPAPRPAADRGQGQ